MAELTGSAQTFIGNTSQVNSSQDEKLGKRAWDSSGNEYIYLQGVGSTVAGDWVVYDESYATTRLVANEVGPVAIAMAAVDATTKYGWYQIFGKNTVARTDTIAADKALFIDGTTGRVDDLGVAGDLVIGAYSMTADTANVATVWITYPHVSDDLGAGGGVLAGSDTQVQFNDAGFFGADAGLVYNKTTDVLTVAGAVQMETANIEDSDASHYLVIKTTSNLTANRNLTLVPGDAARTITLAGDLNIAADFITSGANSLTLTTTGATNVTLPTTGTLLSSANNLSVFAATTSAQLAGVISDETGSGLLVFATSPVLTTPNIGVATATSVNKVTITVPTTSATLTLVDGSSLVTVGANAITLTSTGATGVTLPTTGILATLAGTETLTNKTFNLTSNTLVGTIAQFNAALSDQDFATLAGTETLTNKSITPKVVSATSITTSVAINADITDIHVVTAQAEAILYSNPTGTLVQGQKLMIRIKDNATARAITWGANFRAMGTALPSTTVLSKTLYLGFIFNSTDTKWDLVASAQES